jgi:hypothetical protein
MNNVLILEIYFSWLLNEKRTQMCFITEELFGINCDRQFVNRQLTAMISISNNYFVYNDKSFPI